ncbi:hypothetical protein MAPG_11014 [Magnaporthiopsis poae ATCC 64411]|uniref:MICOS complex subunit mic19 n=1 Tax=Magnaporthiopsis poae (strain ATCC 64411 / 73-15) TaxID=644358 RepID=A0A0C4EE49_MAGP6|nr:hypothetical protein MAPG_11014 [Magnaporthiopsis poae ATCC 64411]
MGANSSKESPHVWKGSQPAGISQGVLESLQSSTETDASRAQLAELQIQARVAEELRRLQAAETMALREVQEKLSEPSDQDGADGPSRYTLSREAAALRVRLEDEKKKVRNLPDTLENARSEVVRCLRENDRRPLDCWKEVAAFKEEVRKLEKGWVEKVVS